MSQGTVSHFQAAQRAGVPANKVSPEELVGHWAAEGQKVALEEPGSTKNAFPTVKDNDIIYKKYTDSELSRGYESAVEKGHISPLIGYDLYKQYANDVQDQLVGLTTKDGLTISGYTTHFIDRVFGQVADRGIAGKRTGVPIHLVLDALLNPEKISPVVTRTDGKRSIVYYSKEVIVSINPDTKLLIQTNVRSLK